VALVALLNFIPNPWLATPLAAALVIFKALSV
jgi:hypothetical protein